VDLKAYTYYKMGFEEVVKELGSDLTKGLTSADANDRLKKYGTNELAKEEEKSLLARIIESFEDLLVRILLIAATISFVIALTGKSPFSELTCTAGDHEEEGITAFVEPFVILLILIANAIISIWQDSNADKALEALKMMQPIKCLVLRDGTWKEEDSIMLVPGDVVRVEVGDRVPADLRVCQLESISLQVEEAPLTGESVSVQKTTKPMSDDAQMLQD